MWDGAWVAHEVRCVVSSEVGCGVGHEVQCGVGHEVGWTMKWTWGGPWCGVGP